MVKDRPGSSKVFIEKKCLKPAEIIETVQVRVRGPAKVMWIDKLTVLSMP